MRQTLIQVRNETPHHVFKRTLPISSAERVDLSTAFVRGSIGGGVAEVRTPVCYQRPGRPGLDAGTSRCEGFSHPVNTSGIQGTRSSASTTLKMALSSRIASRLGVRRRWRTLLR